MISLGKWVIFRFHVNFPGCIFHIKTPNISIGQVCKLPPDAMACLLNASGFFANSPIQTGPSQREKIQLPKQTNNTSNYYILLQKDLNMHQEVQPKSLKITWDPCLVYLPTWKPKKMNQIVGKAGTTNPSFRVAFFQLGSHTSNIRARRRSPAPRRSWCILSNSIQYVHISIYI